MSSQHRLSCTPIPNTAGTLPTVNGQQLLLCTMVKIKTGDFLTDNADNIWFVLSAYFFAFFPWAIMNNVDFISEKWRTCRRTRNLARIHLAATIFPIIYVAVYAEAQRRDNDYKEFGAAMAALMFNVFQLLRTIMGILQLNAFIAWCKHGVECVRALSGNHEKHRDGDIDFGVRNSEEGASSTVERKLCGLSQLELFVAWCKRGMERMRQRNMRGNPESSADGSATDDVSDLDSGEEIDEKLQVNNTIVDNELGGRELTVLPSCKKMWNGLKRGSFAPSRWLQTGQVMLNTVRWSGAYLCGMGELWTDGIYRSSNFAGHLESFFSSEAKLMLDALQYVQWSIGGVEGYRQLFSIRELAGSRWNDVFLPYHPEAHVELTGEMTTAYGTNYGSYGVCSTTGVGLYSFEFNSLVSSYPAEDSKSRSGYAKPNRNRESVTVGLAHSVLLAKHLGVEKLKSIRQCYDRYQVPLGLFRENAFRLLEKQIYHGGIRIRIPDDANIWDMIGSEADLIPLFPYRMQAVALWEEATSWRVLQASAHQDIRNSLQRDEWFSYMKRENELDYATHRANIFDYCAEWSKQDIRCPGYVGVVLETVRTFLAEWIAESGKMPVWDPEVPKDCFEFDLGETSHVFDIDQSNSTNYAKFQLIWICQRELQGTVAKLESKDENLPGDAALIILFLLSFPLLDMEEVQDTEASARESEKKVLEVTPAYSSDRHSGVNVSVQLWRVWTLLAPQDISLMLRIDESKRTVSVKLQNDSGDTRFIWQDWVDSVMGYIKGYDEADNGKFGQGRTIVRRDLREPMMDLCPLYEDDDDGDDYDYDIDAKVKKTSTARVWMGWPPFDSRIFKFELDQWLAACDVNINVAMEWRELARLRDTVAGVEQVIQRMKSN